MLNEIKRLIPALHSLSNLSSTGKLSLTSIIASTCRAREVFSDAKSHADGCPVLHGSLPLNSPSVAEQLGAHPCQACAQYRLHILSSRLFCSHFEKATASSSSNVIKSDDYEKFSALTPLVVKKYGSFEKFERELLFFCTSSSTPCWTWVGFEPSRMDLRLLNLPSSMVPLSIGVWPLGVINVSQTVLCNSVYQLLADNELKLLPNNPSWRRAARNSSATISGSKVTQLTTMQQLRSDVAHRAIKQINFTFLDAQLQKAIDYYTVTPAKTTLASAQQSPSISAADPHPADSPLTGDAEIASTSPVATYHPSTGIWEYAYKNGDVTLLHPNGTKVFQKKEVTTTVRPDGCTLYEYPNNTSILEKPNGVRIITFPDGSSKEEPY